MFKFPSNVLGCLNCHKRYPGEAFFGPYCECKNPEPSNGSYLINYHGLNRYRNSIEECVAFTLEKFKEECPNGVALLTIGRRTHVYEADSSGNRVGEPFTDYYFLD